MIAFVGGPHCIHPNVILSLPFSALELKTLGNLGFLFGPPPTNCGPTLGSMYS